MNSGAPIAGIDRRPLNNAGMDMQHSFSLTAAAKGQRESDATMADQTVQKQSR